MCSSAPRYIRVGRCLERTRGTCAIVVSGAAPASALTARRRDIGPRPGGARLLCAARISLMGHYGASDMLDENDIVTAILKDPEAQDDAVRLITGIAIREVALRFDRTVDVHVARLRRIFGRETVNIRTVPGVGYAIDPPADE